MSKSQNKKQVASEPPDDREVDQDFDDEQGLILSTEDDEEQWISAKNYDPNNP